MSVLIAIIIFSILIIVHEFGHFIAARRAGVKVEKFAIGFGPALIRIKGKETEFLVCAFPLGGYIKMAGDVRSQCKGEASEFLSRSPGIKSRIVFAGPLFNYLLAFIIFWIIALVGFPYQGTKIGEVLEGYPAESVGVEKGDTILAVNGTQVDEWAHMTKIIRKAKTDVSLEIVRDGKKIALNVPLKKKQLPDYFGIKRSIPIIGISPSPEVKFIRYNVLGGFLKGLESLFVLTYRIVKGLGLMILGVIPFRENITGPLGIVVITGDVASAGGIAILHFIALLSVSLGVINLFPMPILDGGHILFFFLEKIRRKPIAEKTEDILTRIGFTFLAVLMVFVLYNDIVKFGSRIWSKQKSTTSDKQ